MFINGFEPDSNGIKLAFECPSTDRIELAMLSSQIMITHCLRIAIEKQDYKQILRYLEMAKCNLNMFGYWATQKIEETEPSDN